METCPKKCTCPVSPSITELISVTQKLIAERPNTAGQKNSLTKLNLELMYQETRCSNKYPLSCREVRKLLFELIVTGVREDPFNQALKSIHEPGSKKARTFRVNRYM